MDQGFDLLFKLKTLLRLVSVVPVIPAVLVAASPGSELLHWLELLKYVLILDLVQDLLSIHCQRGISIEGALSSPPGQLLRSFHIFRI